MIKKSIKKRKNPWLAGILNFLLPGLGYAYAGKKRAFVSYGFLALSIFVAIYEWGDIVAAFSGKMNVDFMVYIVIYPIVFAYDAYADALTFNKYNT